MNLKKRRELSARVLGVGKNRIIFNPSHLAEIKEAITKQDIRDMYADGIIGISEKKGRKSKEKRHTRRGFGKIKKMINPGKAAYIIRVRKQRKYIKELLLQNKLDREQYFDLRKKIRASTFKNKAHLKDHIKTK
jgi:large subunit ribosomal protein L19e